MDVRIFRTVQGQEPFTDWLLSLRNKMEQARIRQRLDRLGIGNLGDYKSVGNGVYELRFFFGAGYRVYFGLVDGRVVLLLGGGDKDTQQRDIEKAKAHWQDYQHGKFS
jgi:putative addiction module killer protein